MDDDLDAKTKAALEAQKAADVLEDDPPPPPEEPPPIKSGPAPGRLEGKLDILDERMANIEKGIAGGKGTPPEDAEARAKADAEEKAKAEAEAKAKADAKARRKTERKGKHWANREFTSKDWDPLSD